MSPARPSAPRREHRPRRLVAVLGIAAVVVAIDQVTKTMAVDRLSSGPVHLFGPVGFDLAYNSGIAFSIGSGLTLPIVLVVAVLGALLLWFGRGAPSTPAAIGVGLVLGGAVGNLADRLFRGHRGAVVDFVHVGIWPTFNLADASVVCGCATLAIVIWRRTTKQGTPATPGAVAGEQMVGGEPRVLASELLDGSAPAHRAAGGRRVRGRASDDRAGAR